MSTLKNLSAVKLLKCLAIVFASVYLTFLIDIYTLNTTVKRLFVFGYFLVICTVMMHLRGRFLKLVHPRRTVLLSAVAAILIFATCQGTFLPDGRDTLITLTAAADGEVWLADVVVDGEVVPLSQISVEANSGWLYNEEYDDYVFYPGEEGTENYLTLQFVAEDIKLDLAANPWSGSVSVTASTGVGSVLDLCSDEESRTSFSVDCQHTYTPMERCVYGVGVVLVLGFLLSVLLSAASMIYRKNWNEEIFVLLLLTFFLLFFTSPQITPDIFTKIFLAVLTAASFPCLLPGSAEEFLGKYRTVGKKSVIVAIAVYASLASFGQRFFLDGNTRMHFSAAGLAYIVLGAIWFVPIVYLLLLGLEWLASQRKARTETAHHKRVFWALLGILCVCQAIVLWAFWPGGFAADNIHQLLMAFGDWELTDWHPLLDTLRFRYTFTLIPTVGAIAGVQLFFFALLCTKFLMLGYDYGISFKSLVILGCIFILLPNQVFSGILTEKDYPYTLSLLWGTYLLIRMSIDPRVLRKWYFLIAMALDLFFIYGFRHNGIVPFIALLLLFVFLTVRQFSWVRLRLVVVSIAGILLVTVYKGPVFSLLNVQPNMVSPYTTMLCATASCVNKDLPLSEETNAILETVIPLEQWGDYYNRYLGHDLYHWGRGELSAIYPFDNSHITAEMAFSVYFEALTKYPDVVIKDRLDGMDIMWDVHQPVDSYNTRTFDFVSVIVVDGAEKYFNLESMEQGSDGNYYNRSPLAETYRKALNTAPNSVFDILLWRTGAYLILMMVLGVFWWGNRMKGLLWATIPLLGNIAGWVLLLYHQSFRYVYAIQVLIIALMFCSICLRNRECVRR